LENTYIKSNFIAQVYIHGDSLQSELVAIVVPDPEVAVPWGIAHHILPTSTPPATAPQPGQPPHPALLTLVQSDKFRKAVQEDMNRLAKADKLRGFEVVKKIGFEVEPWSVANGLLTPSFKLKRVEAAEKYRSVIDGLYKELAADKAVSAPLDSTGPAVLKPKL
ncbi:Long chain acyl-CoA synthetase 7 peroxisomal, partial [Rhizophlyctis rosea]